MDLQKKKLEEERQKQKEFIQAGKDSYSQWFYLSSQTAKYMYCFNCVNETIKFLSIGILNYIINRLV